MRGGSSRWLTRWRTPMATATLLSQRARPRCCGRGLARKALLEAGWHGFPASAATKRNEAAPPVSAPRPAHLTGEKKVVRATPRFLALMRHRSRLSGPPSGPPLNPPREGRSHHRDPWREGRHTQLAAPILTLPHHQALARTQGNGSHPEHAAESCVTPPPRDTAVLGHRSVGLYLD